MLCFKIIAFWLYSWHSVVSSSLWHSCSFYSVVQHEQWTHRTVKNDSWKCCLHFRKLFYNPWRQQNSVRVSFHNCGNLWHVYIRNSVTIMDTLSCRKRQENHSKVRERRRKVKTSLDNNDVENMKRAKKLCNKRCVIKFIVLQLPIVTSYSQVFPQTIDRCEEVHFKPLFRTNFVLRWAVNYQQFELKVCDMYPVDWFSNSSKEHAEYFGADKRLPGKTVNERPAFCHVENAAFRATEIDNQHVTCLDSIA